MKQFESLLVLDSEQTFVPPHSCPCGAFVDARGSHGLSCRRSAGRQTRHAQLNDAIHRALVRAGIPSTKEPVGLMRSGDGRPDGCTLVSWEEGKCLAWDATVPDTLAHSHLAETSLVAGAASERAAKLKNDKYQELKRTYLFCPGRDWDLGSNQRRGGEIFSLFGPPLVGIFGRTKRDGFSVSTHLCHCSEMQCHLVRRLIWQFLANRWGSMKHTFFLTPNFINPAGTEYRG